MMVVTSMIIFLIYLMKGKYNQTTIENILLAQNCQKLNLKELKLEQVFNSAPPSQCYVPPTQTPQ